MRPNFPSVDTFLKKNKMDPENVFFQKEFPLPGFHVDGRNPPPPGMYPNPMNCWDIECINWLARFLNHQQYVPFPSFSRVAYGTLNNLGRSRQVVYPLLSLVVVELNPKLRANLNSKHWPTETSNKQISQPWKRLGLVAWIRESCLQMTKNTTCFRVAFRWFQYDQMQPDNREMLAQRWAKTDSLSHGSCCTG